MEGIAAVAVTFLLFTVLVQAATALIAHQSAEAAVSAAARRGALGSSDAANRSRLLTELEAIVPGGRQFEAGIEHGAAAARAWARFVFVPPGPVLRRFTFSVDAEVPVVVTP